MSKLNPRLGDLMKRAEWFSLYFDVGFLCWWAGHSAYRASEEMVK
jgi:hypothetical protein